MDAQPIGIDTPHGPARVTLREPSGVPVGTLLLGHGAGGGIAAPDLVAVTAAVVAGGWRVGLVEQPWRVAGKRVASPPPRLDEAWLAVVAALGERLGPGPLVVGGRSAGARVACRTAAASSAAGVLCLAFPLHPPGRPERSRAAELPVELPVCVVQGRRDAFGTPEQVGAVAGPRVTVIAVDGDHALRADRAALTGGVLQWLAARAGPALV